MACCNQKMTSMTPLATQTQKMGKIKLTLQRPMDRSTGITSVLRASSFCSCKISFTVSGSLGCCWSQYSGRINIGSRISTACLYAAARRCKPAVNRSTCFTRPAHVHIGGMILPRKDGATPPQRHRCRSKGEQRHCVSCGSHCTSTCEHGCEQDLVECSVLLSSMQCETYNSGASVWTGGSFGILLWGEQQLARKSRV